MKRLYFMRHAKAHRDSMLGDHELPLNPRGRSACILLAAHIKENNIQPDLILASTAARAQETLKNILPAMGNNTQTESRKNLYLASAGELFKAINAVDDSVDSLMIIAHNPGIHQICMMLVDYQNSSEKLRNVMVNMPTAGLASFSINTDSWKNVEPESGRLEDFISPEDLSF